MSRLKKFLILFLLFFYTGISLIVPHAAQAQESSWYRRDYDEWFTIVFDPSNPEEIFGERYTYAQVEWVIYSLMAFIIRSLGDANVIGCVLNNKDDLSLCADELCTAFANMGLKDIPIVGGIPADIAAIPACTVLLKVVTYNTTPTQENNDLLATITSRPISGVTYLKDRLNKLHLVPEVKAQGFGFGAAEPIRAVWIAVRNVTYFFLVIVMVIMAFMIMFRIKTSPQTVITIQSAIPKLIGALILITFSYAIAGFMIDLMYLIIGIIAAVLTSSGLSTFNAVTMFNALTQDRSVLQLMTYYFLTFMMACLMAMITNVPGFIFSALLPGVTVVLWLLIVIIMAIVLLIATFRIFFVLIKTFVMILLTIITGPIQILMGAMGIGGFGRWMRSLFSYLMVYPTVGFLFFLAFYFLRAAFPDNGVFGNGVYQWLVTHFMPFNIPQALPSGGWTPPLTTGTGDTDLLWLFVSVSVISIIPKASDLVQSISAGRPFAYGSAIGEGLAPFAAGWAMARGLPGAYKDYAAQHIADYGTMPLGLGRLQPRYDKLKDTSKQSIERIAKWLGGRR